MRYRRERRKKTMKIVQEIKDKYQTKEKSLTLSGQLLNHYLSGGKYFLTQMLTQL